MAADVQPLFPLPGVVARCVPMAATATGLLPEEHADVASAPAARQRAFATGRGLVRRLLAELGHGPHALPIGPRGAPRWPAGVVGALAHTDALCAAVVAQRGPVLALGIDLEEPGPVSDDLLQLVARAEEREWIAAAPGHARERRARLLFSAKESFFKCQGDAEQLRLTHHDVRVVFAAGQRSFVATRLGGLPPGAIGTARGFCSDSGPVLATGITVTDCATVT